MDAIPSTIREGMTVVDRSLEEIGTVETFRIGDEDPMRPGPETSGVSPVLKQERNTLASVLADVFLPEDRLPREMQEKALREGVIRLDAHGLFAADRYIFPEHIDRIEGERLVLAVDKQDLFKA